MKFELSQSRPGRIRGIEGKGIAPAVKSPGATRRATNDVPGIDPERAVPVEERAGRRNIERVVLHFSNK